MLSTKRELAQRWKVSPRTIENYMRRGIIPFIKIQNVVRFKTEDVDAALEKLTTRHRGSRHESGGNSAERTN